MKRSGSLHCACNLQEEYLGQWNGGWDFNCSRRSTPLFWSQYQNAYTAPANLPRTAIVFVICIRYLSVWNTFVLFVSHLHRLGGWVGVLTRPLLENWGIFFFFFTMPRDFSSLHSARNSSEFQAAFCSVSWLSALWQCGMNLTTRFHLELKLGMSGLLTPLVHSVQSEKLPLYWLRVA
jgi:hypothetical protein